MQGHPRPQNAKAPKQGRETLWTLKLIAFVFFTLLSHSSAFQDEEAPFKYFPFLVFLDFS